MTQLAPAPTTLASPTLEIDLLGPLQVRVGGVPIVIAAPKVRGLLALLALRHGSVVSSSVLIDSLWGDAPSRSCHKAVQTYVSTLRRLLPPESVATVAPGYRLSLGDGGLDTDRFQCLIHRAHSAADGGERLALLTDALALWRGPALYELAGSAIGRAESVRLHELRLEAEEHFFDCRLLGGQGAGLVADLTLAVESNPLRERRWAQLMLALYRSGRQADALRAFQRLRRLLDDELGIEPSAMVVALESAVILQKPELAGPQLPWDGERWDAGR